MIFLGKRTVRWIAAPLAAFMFATSFGMGAANAGLVGTDAVAQEQAVSESRERIMSYLDRDHVRDELARYGIDPAEAEARIAALSDVELSRIASQIDSEPAGEGAVGAVVGAALIVFIILLITDIAGVTDAFDFDN